MAVGHPWHVLFPHRLHTDPAIRGNSRRVLAARNGLLRTYCVMADTNCCAISFLPRLTMHTFGAIVLALIGVLLMQALIGLAASYLVGAIASTTGTVWMPLLLGAAFNGCAVYGGLIFALNVAKKSSPKITYYVVLGILLLSLVGSIVATLKEPGSHTALIVGQVLYFIAGAIGGWIAMIRATVENMDKAES